jgi:hypothetical protein
MVLRLRLIDGTTASLGGSERVSVFELLPVRCDVAKTVSKILGYVPE